MAMPFITRDPTPAEELVLGLMISSFTDGSGNQREEDGTSRAGWREIERILSEFFTGTKHQEDKDVFDILVPDWDTPTTVYGVSIKSKQLTGKKTIFHEAGDARAYLELSNSPAKMWSSIAQKTGLTPSAFDDQKSPQKIGEALMETTADWKNERKRAFEARHPGSTLDLSQSFYLTISLSPYDGATRDIHMCSFRMAFPKLKWFYLSNKCLSACDPAHPEERLLDWYAQSGGQLKYYPRFETASFTSTVLKLKRVPEVSIVKKASTYFPADLQGALSRLDPKQLALLRPLID